MHIDLLKQVGGRRMRAVASLNHVQLARARHPLPAKRHRGQQLRWQHLTPGQHNQENLYCRSRVQGASENEHGGKRQMEGYAYLQPRHRCLATHTQKAVFAHTHRELLSAAVAKAGRQNMRVRRRE